MKYRIVTNIVGSVINWLYLKFGPEVMPERYRIRMAKMVRDLGELSKQRATLFYENISFQKEIKELKQRLLEKNL